MSKQPDELPQDARALMACARAQLEPSHERLERVRVRVLQAAQQRPSHDAGPTSGAQGRQRVRVGWRLVLSSALVVAGAAYWLRAAPRPHDLGEVVRRPPAVALDDAGLSWQAVLPGAGPKRPASSKAADPVGPTSVATATSTPSPSGSLPALAAPAVVQSVQRAPLRSGRVLEPGARDRPGLSPVRHPRTATSAPHDDPLGPAFDPPPAADAGQSIGGADKRSERARATRSADTATAARRGAERDPRASDDLAVEVALIGAAQRALSRGDYLGAERVLREHATRFPVGQLHVERVALATRARCLARDGYGAKRLFRELELLTTQASLRRSVTRACGSLLAP